MRKAFVGMLCLLLASCGAETKTDQEINQTPQQATVTPTAGEQVGAAGGQHTYNISIQPGYGGPGAGAAQGLDGVKAQLANVRDGDSAVELASADNAAGIIKVTINTGSTSTAQDQRTRGEGAGRLDSRLDSALTAETTQDIRTRLAAELIVSAALGLIASSDPQGVVSAGEGDVDAEKRTDLDATVDLAIAIANNPELAQAMLKAFQLEEDVDTNGPPATE